MVETSTSQINQHSGAIKIALIGATGAVGKEIVQLAKQNPLLKELVLITRRTLDEWVLEEFSCKLTIVIRDNFEGIVDDEDLIEKVTGCNSFICTLGTRQKEGRQVFRQVDYEYPLLFAQLAKKLMIPEYALLTSMGANSRSCFNYMRVKGDVERDVKALGLKHLTIF